MADQPVRSNLSTVLGESATLDMIRAEITRMLGAEKKVSVPITCKFCHKGGRYYAEIPDDVRRGEMLLKLAEYTEGKMATADNSEKAGVTLIIERSWPETRSPS